MSAKDIDVPNSSGKLAVVTGASGVLELQCQVLTDPDQGHSLLVYTATPGTPSHSNLALLAVVGDQRLSHG